MAHIRLSVDPIMKAMPVGIRILPTPTNGDIIPPARKRSAPNTADELPALSLALSIASVVDNGMVSPIINKIRNIRISYNQKERPKQSTKNSATEKITIPTLPINMP